MRQVREEERGAAGGVEEEGEGADVEGEEGGGEEWRGRGGWGTVYWLDVFESLMEWGRGGKTYKPCTCMLHLPVSGRKKPSATIFARAFGMGLVRLRSTSRREEKVRVLRALGPVRASAAERAMGRRMDCSWRWEAAVMAAVSGEAYRAWSLGGRRFEGNIGGSSSCWVVDDDLVRAASSFP